MSEERYVNRVDQTRLQKIDGSKLAESVDEELYPRRDRKIGTDPIPTATPVPTSLYPAEDTLELAVDLVGSAATLNPNRKKGFDSFSAKVTHVDEAITTDLDWVNSTEPDELPDDNVGNLATLPLPANLDVLRGLIGYPLVQVDEQGHLVEFIEFKKQVIAALRHIGVDVRRFFGE